MVREASSDIHMLSHLVGAANRADIRRLQELEAEKTVLEDKLACQQRHLTETLGAKERRIRELVALLAARDDHAGSKAAGDVVLDSVSHAAAGVARRYARGCGKPLLPVPILSLTSLTRALGTT